MKRAGKGLLVAAGIVAALALTAWLLARGSSPAVPLVPEPGPEHEAALRELIRQVGDPRALEDGQLVTVTLDQRQVDAVLVEASRRRARAGGRARLRAGGVDLTVSAESPWPRLTPFVNLEASLHGRPGAPVVETASIGALPVPAALGQALVDRGIAHARDRAPQMVGAVEAVEDVRYEAERVTVRVRWNEALRGQLREIGREVAADELDPGALLAHAAALAAHLEASPAETHRLGALMTTVFNSVAARVEAGGVPRREVEAAFVLLTLYVLGHSLDDALPATPAPALPERSVVLHDREDLPKHLLVSAVSAIFVDRAFADALGLAKELRDADDADGSGFSFRDLAADRAGVRLATDGLRSDASTRALIARLSAPTDDVELAPAVEDLPEGMDAAAFRAAYEDVESPAYRALVAAIDARIEACDVHRAVRASR